MQFVKAYSGKRDIAVSRLGFGCGRLFGGLESRHSWRLLERAYELGIRHFDTAPSYGHGQSENVIGDVFASVADITIMTKVGMSRPTRSVPLSSVVSRLLLRRALSHAPSLKKKLLRRAQSSDSPAVAPRRKILERDAVTRELDESLKRLRRDRIDFYCVHEPDQYLLNEDLLAIFDDLKAAGGISAHGLAWGRPAVISPKGWNVIQARYIPGGERDGRLRFFHGVLRSSQSDGPARLAAALREEPDAVFIVSASERHQLSDLVKRSAV